MSNVTPTKSNLMAQKRSRALAENGFELMDKKRNILIRELMALMDQAADLQKRVDSTFARAYTALRLANISTGGVEGVAQSVHVDDSLNVRFRSVMGVELPLVTAKSGFDGRIPYGLAGTDSKLDSAFVEFQRVKALLRDLAETENAIFRLAYSIKKTQKRANALKNIVIPGLDASIAKITEELEEKDREEFVRQKVIKAAQKKAG
ncbi:MAG: V-type ATP synthase subunit D [Firmicutes bacterium]|nr:V-type ATP synthase subunit D [Bacillota bacterium]